MLQNKNIASLGVAPLIIIIMLLVLLHLPVPDDTFLWRQLWNFSHVPLFGLTALALLSLSRNVFGHLSWPRLMHYGLALALAVLIAAATEVQQLFTPRDANLCDFIRGVIGVVCTLGFFLTFDTQLNWAPVCRKRALKLAIRFGSMILILVTLAPVLVWADAYRQRVNNLPMICGFDSRSELMFVRTHNAVLNPVPPPDNWSKPDGDLVGHLTFSVSQYPALMITEVYPDWHSFSFLSLSLFSELEDTFVLNLRINDWVHDQQYDDRFNLQVPVSPGLNVLRIPLDDVKAAPAGREMNLGQMQSVILFAVKPAKPFTVYVDDISLQRDDLIPPSP